jgi:hypothetical protein
MSTGRARVGAAVALALAAALTGCGGGDGQDGGSAEGSEPPSASRTPSGATETRSGARQPPSPSPTPTDADGSCPADATDTATGADACFDGRCEIAVSRPMTIKIDSRLGVSDLRITKITDDIVVLQSSGAGTFLSSSVGEGSTGGLNGLGFRVKSLDGGTAVLEFFPRA